jgi:hypothetical protein
MFIIKSKLQCINVSISVVISFKISVISYSTFLGNFKRILKIIRKINNVFLIKSISVEYSIDLYKVFKSFRYLNDFSLIIIFKYVKIRYLTLSSNISILSVNISVLLISLLIISKIMFIIFWGLA